MHITFTTRKATCPPLHINNVQLTQDVTYLGLYLDRTRNWHKHVFVKRKQLEIFLTKMLLVTWTQVKTLYKQQTSLSPSLSHTNTKKHKNHKHTKTTNTPKKTHKKTHTHTSLFPRHCPGIYLSQSYSHVCTKFG
jgi:hypothetical protein